MSKKNDLSLSLEDRQKINQYLAVSGYPKRRKILSLFFIKLPIIAFAIIGFAFLAAYVGVNLHLTDTEGIIDRQTEEFWDINENTQATVALAHADSFEDVFFNKNNYCLLNNIKDNYPGTFWRIINLAFDDKKDLAQKNLDVASKNFSMIYGDGDQCDQIYNSDITRRDFELLANTIDQTNLFLFASSSEWSFFKTAVLKDKDTIKKVEEETGIKSRILVSQLVSEQMRLYYSDRAWFETAISPVKVLTSMSQFSWGVLGVKQDTAIRIEENLKNKESVFYLGLEYESALDFTSSDIQQERFKRITNYKDHYFGYLYAALFNKQIIYQWNKEGFDISNNPGVLATLYNLGFHKSKPNGDPQMGGAQLNIEGNIYSFGRLAQDFYYSGELLDEFPQ